MSIATSEPHSRRNESLINNDTHKHRTGTTSRKVPRQMLNFMESGHIKVDQMRKQYDFTIKGAKVFAACNEITKLSKPLQSQWSSTEK